MFQVLQQALEFSTPLHHSPANYKLIKTKVIRSILARLNFNTRIKLSLVFEVLSSYRIELC